MKTYLAFLRGINVGGKNKVSMLELKKSFEKLGYKDVSTYINSGNVIFNANTDNTQKIASKIEEALFKKFGFVVRTVVRTGVSVRKISKAIPKEWGNDNEQKTDVLFLWPDFESKKSLDFISVIPGIDNLIYVDGAIIWNINRAQYNKSGIKKFIGSELYKNMTARNVNTVRKLAEMLSI